MRVLDSYSLLLLFVFGGWHVALKAQTIPQNVTATQQVGNVLRYEVQFTTPASAQGFVEYVYWNGTDSVAAKTGATAAGTSHAITVMGLLPQTTYRYRAAAFDSLGCYAGTWNTFSVAALPTNLTVGHVTSLSGVAGDPPGYLLSNTAIGDPDRYLQIHDRKGQLIWYERMPGVAAAVGDGPCQHFSYQPSTHSIIMTECGQVTEVALDGRILRSQNLGSIAPGWMAHHDVVRLANGNWLVLAARVDTVDKSSVGGSAAALVVAPGILEVNPAGALVWSWWAADHLDPLSSPAPGGAWVPKIGAEAIDWLGANSLMQDGDGNPMLSFGGSSQVIKVVRNGGTVVWTTGVDGTIEVLPPDTFMHQHALRASRPGYYLSLDNQGLGTQTRAIEWWIDFSYFDPRMEISWQHVLPIADYSAADGNVDKLPSGNFVIGSGSGRTITEITSAGSVLWHAVLDSSLYRAYWVDDFYMRLRPRYTGDLVVCVRDSLVPLRASVPGGIWSGAYVQGDSFNTAAAGLGLHFVTYKLGPEEFTVELLVDDAANCGVAVTPQLQPQIAFAVFPNPMEDVLHLAVDLPRPEELALDVFALDGQWVVGMALGRMSAGHHVWSWDGDALGIATGGYCLRVRAASGKSSSKIIVRR